MAPVKSLRDIFQSYLLFFMSLFKYKNWNKIKKILYL